MKRVWADFYLQIKTHIKNKRWNIPNIYKLIAAIIIVVFAYFGYFPFNFGLFKEVHYMVDDGIHLAFNKPNVTLMNNKKYYCSDRYKKLKYDSKDKTLSIIEKIAEQESELREVESMISNSPVRMHVEYGGILHTYTRQDLQNYNKLTERRDMLNYSIKKNQAEIINIRENYLSNCYRL